MTDFFLVSCVGKKHADAKPAKDLYASAWFSKARAYVERRSGLWFILSAKFGLVDPDQVVDPYNQTLNHMSAVERRRWAQRVRVQMAERFPPSLAQSDRCIILAGARYREFLEEYLNERYKVEIPMRGLTIGKQLQWLDNYLTADDANVALTPLGDRGKRW